MSSGKVDKKKRRRSLIDKLFGFDKKKILKTLDEGSKGMPSRSATQRAVKKMKKKKKNK